MVIGKASFRLGAIPSFSPIFLHDLFCAVVDGFRFEVFLFLLFGLPIVHYVIGVVFCLNFDSFFFSFLVLLWDVFHLFIYEGVLQDNNVFNESSTNNRSPKLILPKKPNKPKNNSGGEDTIAIFANPTKT